MMYVASKYHIQPDGHDAIRLSYMLIKDGYSEINATVSFCELRDKCSMKSEDNSLSMPIEQLLKNNQTS